MRPRQYVVHPDDVGLHDRCPELALEAKQDALSLDRESRFIRDFEWSIESSQQSSREPPTVYVLSQEWCNVI